MIVPFPRESGCKASSCACTRSAQRTRQAQTVITVLDSAPVLDESLLALGRWIASYYLAPLGEVYRTMLPLAAEFKQVVAYRITERGTEALYASRPSSRFLERRSHNSDPERPDGRVRRARYLAEGELVREATLRAATGASRETLRNLVGEEVDRPRRPLRRARCPANR